MEFVRAFCMAVILFLTAAASSADSSPSDILDVYFKGIVAGKSADAFDQLMTHSKIDELKPREITLVKGQIEQGLALYGVPKAYERISVKEYGSSVQRYVYITKHADLPLVWNFFFYKSDASWDLLNFDFNDQLQKLD